MRLVIIFLFTTILATMLHSQPKDNFSAHKTKNFRILYERTITKSQINSIATDLELQFREWIKRLNIKPNKLPFEVRVYKTERKYFQESSIKTKDLGTFSNKKIFLAPPDKLDEKGSRINIISKVVVLAILSTANDNGCPTWLTEAYSIYAGGELEKYSDSKIITPISFLDFQQEYNQIKKEKGLIAFHAKISKVIEFLLDRFGVSKLDSLFIKFEGLQPLETVFEKHFGEKYSDIEKSFNETVKALKPKR